MWNAAYLGVNRVHSVRADRITDSLRVIHTDHESGLYAVIFLHRRRGTRLGGLCAMSEDTFAWTLNVSRLTDVGACSRSREATRAAIVCAIGRSSSSSSSDTLSSRAILETGPVPPNACCVLCHPPVSPHPPSASPPIERPAMERSNVFEGWSSGLYDTGAALIDAT